MSAKKSAISYRNRQIKDAPGVVPCAPTVVVNVTDPAATRWRYIGRAFPARNLAASRWANTFRVEVDTPAARVEALKGYVTQLHASGLFYKVAELRGESLGCFCAPKACHGHPLAALANALRYHGGTCPNCSGRVESSPMARAAAGVFAEYWRCTQCGCWDFCDLGRVQLIPEELTQ